MESDLDGLKAGARHINGEMGAARQRPDPQRLRGSGVFHNVRLLTRGQTMNTYFSFSNFSGTPGRSQQTSPEIPPKTLVSLGFEGHTELFRPRPFEWKTPTQAEDILTKKFGFVLLFLPTTQGASLIP